MTGGFFINILLLISSEPINYDGEEAHTHIITKEYIFSSVDLSLNSNAVLSFCWLIGSHYIIQTVSVLLSRRKLT